MGGVSNTFNKITNAISKPFKQLAGAVLSPLLGRAQQAQATTGSTAAAPAADVGVAATTPSTQTEDTTKRAGLMRSAKGKKSLTVSRASGGGLNV